jgi:hypothetical protein
MWVFYRCLLLPPVSLLHCKTPNMLDFCIYDIKLFLEDQSVDFRVVPLGYTKMLIIIIRLLIKPYSSS